MCNEVKISVIVPVYNAKMYIKRCVDSILNQTYRNFELLLIDDGSSDNSGVICDEYAAKDNRIRVIHKDNSGVADTRNVGLQQANGDYILFVDSDDYIKVDMLEKLVKRAIECDSDIVMCKYFTDKSGNLSTANMKYDEIYDGAERVKNGLIYLYYADYHNGLYSLCNKLIKKCVFNSNNITFDTSLNRGEDAWFIFQCLKYCKRVDFIPEALYYYYQNENSIMHNIYPDQYERWVDMRKRLLKENEELKFEIDFTLFYRDFFYKLAIYCKNEIERGNDDRVKKILSDDFYRRTVKYVDKLPMHIKLIHKSALIHPKLAIIVLKLWGTKNKGVG